MKRLANFAGVLALFFSGYLTIGALFHWLLFGPFVDWSYLPSIVILLAWPVIFIAAGIIYGALEKIVQVARHTTKPNA
jgi:low affinity Fe/Cu permease